MSDANETHDIGEIQKNGRETLKIQLSVFNGHKLVNARIFAPYASGEVGPTSKGLALKVDQLPALIEALSQAHAKAKALGWLGSGR